jgi:uncharacterized protein (TIGR03437 family)
MKPVCTEKRLSNTLRCLVLVVIVGPPGWAQSGSAPTIKAGGVVPIYSSSTTIQPGEWVSIYGTNLAAATTSWTGNFPTSLGGTSVTINGKSAYLWVVSPTQINLQAPDDTATGAVPVVVTTGSGSATSTVTLAQFGPSFSLLDSKHVAGVIIRSDGSGAYGGGTYDILGPTGNSLGYTTVAAAAGDDIVLFGVGFGPTSPAYPAGQALPPGDSGTATNPIQLTINGTAVTPEFAGITEAGLFQINLTLPAGLGAGDVSLVATVGGVQTPSGVVISLQNGVVIPKLQSLTLSPTSVAGGGSVTGTVVLSSSAPAGGTVVALSSGSSTASVPATVTVPAGSTSATFTVSTSMVASNQTVTIVATYNGSTAQATLTVTPPAGPLFSELIADLTFQPAGSPSGAFVLIITPDTGNVTYSASEGNISFTNGTLSNQGQTITFNGIQPGPVLALFIFGSTSLDVSSATLSLTLKSTSSLSSVLLGSITGTLSVTGVPYPSGGNAVTLSGAITGMYFGSN